MKFQKHEHIKSLKDVMSSAYSTAQILERKLAISYMKPNEQLNSCKTLAIPKSQACKPNFKNKLDKLISP